MMNEQPPPLQKLDEAALLAYFGAVRRCAPTAADASAGHARQFSVGGKVVTVRSAQPALLKEMSLALQHIRYASGAESELTIHLWHSAAKTRRRPPSPLAWYREARPDVSWTQIKETHYDSRGEVAAFNSERIRLAFHTRPNILQMLDRQENEAIYWIESSAKLPYYEKGSPFHKIFSWWLSEHGRLLVHGAAVGSQSGAVLLIGPSGTGKSTSSLAALSGGLHYLGDDYCLAAVRPRPLVYSLYNTAKLKGVDDLARFPHLRPLVANIGRVGPEKAQLFLNNGYQGQLAKELPLKGILLPQVNGSGETTLSRLPRG